MIPALARLYPVPLSFLATGLLLFFTMAVTPAEGRIQAITLSAGGMAEVHRQARVTAEGALRLEVPLEQVDDILKSLIVRDEVAQVVSMTLEGLAPVEETFARAPFTPADLVSVWKLASALQGVPVRVASRGRTAEGVVLGVAQVPEADGDGDDEPTMPALSVLATSGQIQSLTLAADASIDILDASVLEKLRATASIVGRARTEQARELTITLSGSEERNVTMSYVVAAPVWKSAFRLLLGPESARLQAWAVVENATGEDWQDVDLTLSSGAPVMLAQALHRRYWHQRPQVPVATGAAQPPRPDRATQRKAGDMVSRAMPSVAAIGGVAAERAAPAPAPMASPTQGAATPQESQVAAAYRLPHPVTLPAGQTLASPYIDAKLPAESVSVFQPDRSSIHPIAAVILENTTRASLPPGILTVYDEDGRHVGDAHLSGIPVGETRIASFAEDRKVEVATDARPVDRITKISIVDGVLHAARLSRVTTTYNIKGASDAARTVVVEHPRRTNWRFAAEALDGETPDHYRLRIRLEPGATGALYAVEERQDSEEVVLTDMSTDTLLFWSGSAADPETARQLQTLAERRRELARAQQREAAINRELERIVANQARIRDNLSAVRPDSALAQRYTEMLAQEEDRIATQTEMLKAAQTETASLRQALTADL